MATGQLWLFPPPKPLVDRLGEDFFRRLPERPGVYLMCGPESGVLYVGRAKNLRRRLSSYRVANPERFPRRIIRLLHCVTRIEYDECASESAAHAREETLICTLAPRFNRAGAASVRMDGDGGSGVCSPHPGPLPQALSTGQREHGLAAGVKRRSERRLRLK